MLLFKLKVSARPAAVSVISSMVMPLVMNKKPASMVYYKAYERVERNALISGYTDVTPFLFYFCNEVYNRLQVDAVPSKTDLEVYQTALAEGKITEKERLLWEYVLSAYGAEEFTTKQLEKDFRNAAYATIRTFVMKFHEMGLLTARKAGNRVFYRVGGTSDGRPL